MTKSVSLLLAIFITCGIGQAQEADKNPAMGSITTDDGFGIIKGKILFSGEPILAEIPINKDVEVCGHGKRTIRQIEVKDGVLLDAIVFLDGKYEGAKWDNTEVSDELVQEGCFFKPYVGIWKRNGEVKIISKDPAAHNIHTYERIGLNARKDLFNFNQPEQDIRSVKIKPRRSILLELTCDNHDFMAGWRLAAENPYCTVAAKGTFELKVPAGEHTIKAWHPHLGLVEKEVEVSPGQTIQIELTPGDEDDEDEEEDDDDE